jgi:hypothetical protein
MITFHRPAVYVESEASDRKDREEITQRTQRKQTVLLFSSRPLQSKAFCEDHVKLHTTWRGIVAGERLNLRLPIPPESGSIHGILIESACLLL